MINRISFLNIANNLSNEMHEGGELEANQALKTLYKNNVMQLAFLQSTGKAMEYETWVKRFHKTHPGLAKNIEQNLELTEEYIEETE